MNEISYEDAISLENPLFIDVRAPVEFSKDHIPGSINMPLFDDDERSEIGKIYRLLGKDDAVIKGSEIVGGKIGDIVANVKKIKDKDIVIYCFRGGMRSSSIASLLSTLEFNVSKLKDGYKGYRRYINHEFQHLQVKPKVFVLHGLTGTGKTEILRNIPNSIDLEDLAGHRSSVFGGIGLVQKSQKMFESLLLKRIRDLDDADYIVLEGESRKIGDLYIPDRLLNILHNSPAILINASIERRIQVLLDEYNNGLDTDEITSIVKSISNRIGKKNATLLIDLFNKGDLFEFTRLLLVKYYDPLYEHSMGKMSFIAEIENDDSARAAREVVGIVEVGN